jgi:hypothetical protein
MIDNSVPMTAPVPALQERELSRAVEAATGGPIGDPSKVRVDGLRTRGASGTGGIWRFSGAGWSLVLKILRHSEQGSDMWRSGLEEDHWYYWRREALAYGAGMLDEGAGGLRPARCHLQLDLGQEIHLWLEDVAGRPGHEWSPEAYGEAALRLGRFQGTWSFSRRLPNAPWLAHDWLRRYTEHRALDWGDRRADWSSPRLRAVIGGADTAVLDRLWERLETNLRVVEAMPPTLCHGDLHPDNLFGGEEETVLIDWAFVGVGPLGEDAGNLVLDSVLDFHLPADRIGRLWELISEGYAEGLTEGGWSGDRRQVERAMAAALAAKYAWVPFRLAAALAEGEEMINRLPAAEAAPVWGAGSRFLAEVAERFA